MNRIFSGNIFIKLQSALKHRPLFLFGFLVFMVLVFAAGNLASPREAGQGPDEMLHISLHLAMANAIKSGLGNLAAPLAESMRKPHLPYLVSGLFSSIAPAGFASLLAANYLFLILWLAAVFAVGRQIGGSAVGAVSACAAAALPMTWRLGEHFGNDMPAAFFVIFILLLCLKYELFAGFWMWAIVGLIGGLGMLTKPTLPLYVIGALVYLAARSLRQAALNRKKSKLILTCAGIVAAPVIAAAIWLPWFSYPVGAIRELFGKISVDAGHAHGFFHSINGETAPEELIARLGWLGASAVGGGVIAMAFLWKNEKARILIFAFWPPLIVFTVITQAFTRMIFPVLAAPVVLGCAMIGKIRRGGLRNTALIAAAAVAIGVYVYGHRDTRIVFPPGHNTSNPAYAAEPAIRYIGNRAVSPADLLVVSRCRFQNLPKAYFIMLSALDIQNIKMAHLWEETGLFPGLLFHRALPRRLEHVKWIVECREDAERDAAAIRTSLQEALNDAYRLDGVNPETISRPLPAFDYVYRFPTTFSWGAEKFHLHIYERKN